MAGIRHLRLKMAYECATTPMLMMPSLTAYGVSHPVYAIEPFTRLVTVLFYTQPDKPMSGYYYVYTPRADPAANTIHVAAAMHPIRRWRYRDWPEDDINNTPRHVRHAFILPRSHASFAATPLRAYYARIFAIIIIPRSEAQHTHAHTASRHVFSPIYRGICRCRPHDDIERY